MIICGICFLNTHLEILSKIGVKDSKKLSPDKRSKLSHFLKKNCLSYNITTATVSEIDERINRKITLNRLEELKMAEIINDLRADMIYIDAADVNEKRFGKSIRKLLEFDPKLIISEHKADEKYPIVSAASILAKHERDSIIAQLRQVYGDFGSGYTSDKKTINFLRQWISKHKSFPPFVRKSWETAKVLSNELLYNKKLTDFI